MIILFIVSFLICFGYSISVYIKFNVSSISESFYMFEKQKEGRGLLFLGWSTLTAITLLPLWLEITPDGFQFLSFLSSVSLVAVGCAPKYRHEHKTLHPLFTGFSLFLAILWSTLIGLWYLPFIVLLTTAITLFLINIKSFKKNEIDKTLEEIGFMFWMELAAFISIYSCILYKILN